MKNNLRTASFFLASIALMLSVEFAIANPIPFIGRLDLVETDTGTGIYSNIPAGTVFSGFIDDFSFNGVITDGTTSTAFGCCIAAGGLTIENDLQLDAETANLLNQFAGSTIFTTNQVVDSVQLEGDVLIGGSRIEAGLTYFLNGSAFNNESQANYPFDQADVLLSTFFILEDAGTDLFDGSGLVLDLPPQLSTGFSGAGGTDAQISTGISNDAGASYLNTITVGDTVSINSLVQPDSSHVGATLDIIVVAEFVANGDLLLFTSGGLFPYVLGDPFLPFTTVTDAATSNLIPIMNNFEVTTAEIGNYNLYVGYLVEGDEEDIYYTLEPATLNVIGN